MKFIVTLEAFIPWFNINIWGPIDGPKGEN